MELDIVVIGSGLSSLFFCESYLKNKESINIISFEGYSNNSVSKFLSNKQINNLPLQIKRKDYNNISSFFIKNNININQKTNIFGILNQWGNSNYWGYGIDNYYEDDLFFFNQINKDRIKNIFKNISNKYNFIGRTYLNEDDSNKFVIGNFYNKILNFNGSKFNIKIKKSFLGVSDLISTYRNNILLPNNDWNIFRESNFTLNPETGFKLLKKNKKIIFHNYFVRKILFENNKYILICEDRNSNVIKISAKKIILSCGTISTTKLVTDFIKFDKEIKILHHPMNFTLYFSKHIVNDNFFLPPQINFQSIQNNNTFISSNLRSSSIDIQNKIFNIYKYLFFINLNKKLFTKISKYFLFVNNYLDTSYSNLYFLNNDGKINIYSKNNLSINKKLSFASRNIYNFLRENNVIYPFYKNYFPHHGADCHYVGTLPISNNNGKISVNEECQLKNHKNFFIIDGSVLNLKSNKFPTGLIISNAYRIGENLSK